MFEETKRIPLKKSDLYRAAMDCLLQKWDESKDIKRDQIYRVLSLTNKKKLLAQLAFEFSSQGIIYFDQDKAATLIVDFLALLDPKGNDDEIDGEIALNAIETQHGLIAKRSEYVYSFSHLSFQEYFASRYVVENNTDSILKEFFSHVDDDTWEEIFLLTSGMQENADFYFNEFLKIVDSKILQDKKLVSVMKWATKSNQENSQRTHPALSRMIAIRTLLNIDDIVNKVKPEISQRDYFVAEKLASFLHVDIKTDVELSVLQEIANCIAFSKPLSKNLRNEFVRLLGIAENRAIFYQEGPTNKNDFSPEYAREKIRNYISDLDHETKQQFKVNLDSILSDNMIREFSEALNINLTSLTETFFSRERILANNKLPKQNANTDEWNSFRKGIKKDILGDSSLLYDLSMSHDQKSKLIEFLSNTFAKNEMKK